MSNFKELAYIEGTVGEHGGRVNWPILVCKPEDAEAIIEDLGDWFDGVLVDFGDEDRARLEPSKYDFETSNLPKPPYGLPWPWGEFEFHALRHSGPLTIGSRRVPVITMADVEQSAGPTV